MNGTKEMKIADLEYAPYNPRTMPESELEKLKDSILHYGHVQVFVVNKQNHHVIGGNQTLRAIRELQQEHEDATTHPQTYKALHTQYTNIEDRINRLEHLAKETANFTQADIKQVDLSLDDEKTLNIALNKISGTWDYPKLTEIFLDLKDNPTLTPIDLELTGFNANEIDQITELVEFDEDIDLTQGDGLPVKKKGKTTITCPNCGETFEPDS